MRRQFNLQDYLKDKSQKVETRDGRIVHDIWPVKEPLIFNDKRAEVCALIDGEEDALVFFEGGKYLTVNSESPFDLFIVAPEEKLTKFEKAFDRLAELYHSDKNPNDVACCKEYAAKLLALAIDARATELSEDLKQSKLDKDSIPYHLIEFMCNLYTCQNWKEIEETAELYATRIKAAAMKDLPRWKKFAPNINDPLSEQQICAELKNSVMRVDDGGYCWIISREELNKLPKEDESHE